MTSPLAADWYPDPFGRHEHRFWDGTRWTQHVTSSGSQTVDPPIAAPPAPESAGEVPADWYPDPTGRYPVRYWDGVRWTEHVASDGRHDLDALPGVAPQAATPPAGKRAERAARQVIPHAVLVGGGTLFTEPVLVVSQKVKVLGGAMSYAIFDQRGHQLGTVEEIPRSLKAKTSDSFYGRTDDSREYTFRIMDVNRHTHLTVTRLPKRSSDKSQMIVRGGDGATIGHITQETYGLTGRAATVAHQVLQNAGIIAGLGAGLVAGNAAGTAATKAAGKAVGWVAGIAAGAAGRDATRAVFDGTGADKRIASAAEGLDRVGHVRFGLEAGGVRLGTIHAETAAEWDFRIQDPTGTELGRITKTWSGWAQERFTRADNYVLQLGRRLEGPLLWLVTAAALAIDIALKEGDPARDAAQARRRPR